MMLSYTITEIIMLVIGSLILGALIDRMYAKHQASRIKEINR